MLFNFPKKLTPFWRRLIHLPPSHPPAYPHAQDWNHQKKKRNKTSRSYRFCYAKLWEIHQRVNGCSVCHLLITHNNFNVCVCVCVCVCVWTTCRCLLWEIFKEMLPFLCKLQVYVSKNQKMPWKESEIDKERREGVGRDERSKSFHRLKVVLRHALTVFLPTSCLGSGHGSTHSGVQFFRLKMRRRKTFNAPTGRGWLYRLLCPTRCSHCYLLNLFCISEMVVCVFAVCVCVCVCVYTHTHTHGVGVLAVVFSCVAWMIASDCESLWVVEWVCVVVSGVWGALGCVRVYCGAHTHTHTHIYKGVW